MIQDCLQKFLLLKFFRLGDITLIYIESYVRHNDQQIIKKASPSCWPDLSRELNSSVQRVDNYFDNYFGDLIVTLDRNFLLFARERLHFWRFKPRFLQASRCF